MRAARVAWRDTYMLCVMLREVWRPKKNAQRFLQLETSCFAMIICMHASSVFASATCLSEKVCHSETIDVLTSNHRVTTQYTERSTHGLVHRGDCCGQHAPQYSRGHIALLSVLFLYFFRAGLPTS